MNLLCALKSPSLVYPYNLSTLRSLLPSSVPMSLVSAGTTSCPVQYSIKPYVQCAYCLKLDLASSRAVNVPLLRRPSRSIWSAYFPCCSSRFHMFIMYIPSFAYSLFRQWYTSGQFLSKAQRCERQSVSRLIKLCCASSTNGSSHRC